MHYTQTAYDFLRKYEGPKSELGSRFVISVARGNHFPAGVHYSSVQCLTKVPSAVLAATCQTSLSIWMQGMTAMKHDCAAHIVMLQQTKENSGIQTSIITSSSSSAWSACNAGCGIESLPVCAGPLAGGTFCWKARIRGQAEGRGQGSAEQQRCLQHSCCCSTDTGKSCARRQYSGKLCSHKPSAC